MKRFLIVLFFLALHIRVSAQQFSQYNTGTLYDGFENPAQKVFIPDSSRRVAFNIFVPNFSTDATLTGDAQGALKQRAIFNNYDNVSLPIGQGKLNRINANFNAYAFMLKVYTSLNGDQEFGLFIQTKAESRGIFSDESIQVLADNSKFTNREYDDAFNTRFQYQVYHEAGFTYRGNITKNFALGVKLSSLFGVVYNKVDIYHSVMNFDRGNDRAFLSLAGNYYASFEPGKFTKNDLLPTTQNPGAAISFGSSYVSPKNVRMQFNIKDLGFIHWNQYSVTGTFNNTGVINGLSERGVEDSVTRVASALVQSNGVTRRFTSPTDGRAEFSIAKTYRITNSGIKYTPTFILSKELFYTGLTGALVNHVNYNNFTGTLTATYDDLRLFNVGGQFMIKSPNAEFFIGCDRLWQTQSFLRALIRKDEVQTGRTGPFSGANFFIGFSLKMGALIEHPANASTIPMGDSRNFVKRFWDRITGRD